MTPDNVHGLVIPRMLRAWEDNKPSMFMYTHAKTKVPFHIVIFVYSLLGPFEIHLKFLREVGDHLLLLSGRVGGYGAARRGWGRCGKCTADLFSGSVPYKERIID